MSEQILSSEEVDAILKVTQDSDALGSSLDASQNADEQNFQNNNVIINIAELMRNEFEKMLSSFLRKKTLIKANPFTRSTIAERCKEETDKYVYSLFRFQPNEYYGVVAINASFLHQVINLLYGGQLNPAETPNEKPGKIGVMIAEKICQLQLSSFIQACLDYGVITSEVIKTSSPLNLATNLTNTDKVHTLDLTITLDETETIIKFMVIEDFLNDFIFSSKKGEVKHREKDFWRTAIKTQVVDSLVTVCVNMPNVTLKVNEFMALKEGDTIPIEDPTLVYICLNNLRLFRAKAGQTNSKRVAKIISQI